MEKNSVIVYGVILAHQWALEDSFEEKFEGKTLDFLNIDR